MPFLWRIRRDGYCWAGSPGARVLITQGEDQGYREYAPLEDHTGLFLTFSTTELTEAGILAFANQYGLLGIDSIRINDRKTEPQELFSIWAEQIEAMADSVEKWHELRKRAGGKEKREGFYDAINDRLLTSSWSGIFGMPVRESGGQRIFQLNLDDLMKVLKVPPPPLLQIIAASREGKVTLETRPVNLLNAMWLQFAYAIVNDAYFRQCPPCGSWFEISPERRRADAQYCKEACRIRAYKQRKKEARRLHAAGQLPKEIAKKLGTTAEVVRGWLTKP